MKKRIISLVLVTVMSMGILNGCAFFQKYKTVPFDGTIENYKYRYTEERDLKWEEDVIQIASDFCNYQAYINENPNYFCVSYGIGDLDTYENPLYDETMRAEFIESINDIIDHIPEQTDYEIAYGLSAAVAKLSDIHSEVYTYDWDADYLAYPISLDYAIDDDGTEAVYVVASDQANSDLLYGQVLAINDYPIEEALACSAKYFPSENPAYSGHVSTFNNYIINHHFLTAVGITEEAATFTVLLQNGETISRTINPMSGEQRNEALTEGGKIYFWDDLAHGRKDEAYYAEMLDEDTLYVRINNMQWSQDSLESIIFSSVAGNDVHSMIIDLRECGGGSDYAGVGNLTRILDWAEVDDVYVLINEHCYSNSCKTAYRIRTMYPNAVFIGTPMGQGPNTFGYWDIAFRNPTEFTSENYQIHYKISNIFMNSDTDIIGPTEPFAPDIEVHQTLSDYMAHIDTVLKYAKELTQ